MSDTRQGVSEGGHTVLNLVDALRDLRASRDGSVFKFLATSRGLLASASNLMELAEKAGATPAEQREDVANAAARLILFLEVLDAEGEAEELRSREAREAQAVDDVLSTAMELGAEAGRLLTLQEGTARYQLQVEFCNELVERINSRARQAQMTGADLLRKAERRLKGQLRIMDLSLITESPPCAVFAGGRADGDRARSH